jgi:bifunctional UDP-N-acetylglucosamine pyrophosphorylase/glucosamine-1-phosphate N-acetyltransferase
MQNTEIIILAAGKGTRMASDLPKCLIEVKGRPMIHRLLSNLENKLIHKPVVVIGHKSEQVKAFLNDRVRYIFQEEQKGTGHATLTALPAVLSSTKYVVVLYADHPFVSSQTVENLIQKLQSHPVAIATTYSEDFEGWRKLFQYWGRIMYSPEGRIKGIIEYKDASEDIRSQKKINPGFYAFRVDWLRDSLSKVRPNNAQGEYYLTDVIKMADSIAEVEIGLFEAMGLNTKEEVAYAESLI